MSVSFLFVFLVWSPHLLFTAIWWEQTISSVNSHALWGYGAIFPGSGHWEAWESNLCGWKGRGWEGSYVSCGISSFSTSLWAWNNAKKIQFWESCLETRHEKTLNILHRLQVRTFKVQRQMNPISYAKGIFFCLEIQAPEEISQKVSRPRWRGRASWEIVRRARAYWMKAAHTDLANTHRGVSMANSLKQGTYLMLKKIMWVLQPLLL